MSSYPVTDWSGLASGIQTGLANWQGGVLDKVKMKQQAQLAGINQAMEAAKQGVDITQTPTQPQL